MLIDSTYKIALFGHRNFDKHKELDSLLYPMLCDFMRSKTFVEIYIGRNGEFDIYTASLVKKAQKAFGTEISALFCVLPYNQKDTEYYEKYYDEVIIPYCIYQSHPKGAIRKRNEWMIAQADLIICYVERNYGGAYQALKYAKRLGKETINLSELNAKDRPI